MSESGTNSLTPGLITLHHLPAAAGGCPARPSSQGQSRGRVKNASVCVHACFGGSVAADVSAQSPPPAPCESNERRLGVREAVVFDLRGAE